MTTYETKEFVDYITFSTTEYVPLDDAMNACRPRKPTIGNYDTALEYECGMIRQWHSTKPEQKVHISIGGAAMSKLRLLGFDDIAIVSWLQSLKKPKFGRIDISVDAIAIGGEHMCSPHFLHSVAMAGWCKSRVPISKPVTNQDLVVETCYFGRETRQRALRIYDKGIDLGETANRIIRYELESREGANKIASEVVQGKRFGGIIRRYFDFPNIPEWVAIMDSEPLPRDRNDDKKSDTSNENRWHWLLTSVAPAIAKALVEDGTHPAMENENLKYLNNLIEFHYKRLMDDKLK